MRRAYIAFGANLSNPRETFFDVVAALGEGGIVIESVSSLWRSPAWPPGSNAPDYLNAVIRVRTSLDAPALMQRLLHIETRLGRVRSVKNAPRTCDLDLIDYDGMVLDDVACTLPHPRMHERDFVLLPLEEVAHEGWRHAVTGEGVEALIAGLGGE